MDFLQIKSEIPSVAPDIVFRVYGWPISNSFLLSFVVTLFFVALCLFANRALKKGYSGFIATMEMIYEGLVSFLMKLGGSERQARFIFPISASIFAFVAVSNIISVIPGLSSISYDGVSVFRTPTADFNTTFGIALGMIVIINVVSFADYGFFEYFSKFFQFKQVIQGFKHSIKDGLFAIINFGIGLLDIISELAKIISLSLRLFGNIYAGEVLIVVLFGALAFVAPTLWMSMSILFGLVQAVVFSSLITVYYAQSRKPD